MKFAVYVMLMLLGMSGMWLGWMAPRAQVRRNPPPTARPKPTTTPQTKSPPPTPRVNVPPQTTRGTAPEIEMVYVPGGTFLMGSPENEPGRSRPDEGPQHRVTVPGFYIGKYEVTQLQWQAVMGSNPSLLKGDNLPVGTVAWNDAQAFCEKLSQATGKTYRLPSEAEWEYACRAGTAGAYAGDLDKMAWYNGNSGGRRHPVGQKQANAFGLYDMHGNVREWCEDVSHEGYNGAPNDGSAWVSGGDQSLRMMRGGSESDAAATCRSAKRIPLPGLNLRISNCGLRVVVSAKTQ